MENEILEIFDGQLAQTATNFTPAQIWERRPYLTGLCAYAEKDTEYVAIPKNDLSAGKPVSFSENVGIDSNAVPLRNDTVSYDTVEMAHGFFEVTANRHDVQDLQRLFRNITNKTSTMSGGSASDRILRWLTDTYEKAVLGYIDACEKGFAQALSNPAGWVIPAKANQEPKTYKPTFSNDATGTLADFNSEDPATVLFDNIVGPLLAKGGRPNVIFIGTAVKDVILSSAYYSGVNTMRPILTPIQTTPRESSATIVATGAYELAGLIVAGCKVIWISSIAFGVPAFNANAAVAANTQDLGTIWTCPIFTNNGMVSAIVSWIRNTAVDPFTWQFFVKYFYLPAVNNASSLYRIIYS